MKSLQHAVSDSVYDLAADLPTDDVEDPSRGL